MNVSFNDYYDADGAAAEAESARFFDSAPLHLLTQNHPSGSLKALDLGCGHGRHLHWLAIRGWTVHGLDRSETAIREAKRRIPTARLDQKDMRFYAPAPAEVESYDAVLALRSLMHLSIEECQRVFLSAFRALKPKTGSLLLSYLVSEEERGERIKLDAHREVSAFHPMQLESLLRQSGFTLVAESRREEVYNDTARPASYLLLKRI